MKANPDPTGPAAATGAEASRQAAAGQFARGVAVTALLTGGLVLLGWVLDVGALKSIGTGLVTMKVNTALGFMLAGAGLWAARPGADHRPRRRLAGFGATVLVLLGLLTLLEYALGWDAGLDRLLLHEGEKAGAATHPGRMAPGAALGFLLFGLALLLRRSAGWQLGQGLSLAVNLLGVLTLLSYLYHRHAPQLIPQFTAMALHSAALFVLLGAGLLAAQPGRGLAGLLVSATVGGKTARRLLPVALLLPPLLGWLSLAGEKRGWFRAEVGVVLVVLACSFIIGTVVWWGAHSLHFSDLGRRVGERRIRRLNRTYAVLSGINQLTVRERRPQTVFGEACRLAVDEGGFPLAWIGLTEAPAGPLRLAAHAGVTPEARATAEALLSHGADTLFATVQQSGRLLLCNDTAQAGPAGPWREVCRAGGYRALVVLPLKTGGQVTGTFNLCAAETGFFDADELRLLDELAADISFALEVARQEVERRKAEDELRWRTAFFEAQVNSALDGILVVDRAGKKLLQNERFNQLWKIPPPIAGDPDDAVQIEFATRQTKDPAQFLERVHHLYAHPDEISRDEIELLDGTILDRYSAPVRDPAGNHFGRIWSFRDLTERRHLEERLRRSQKLEAIGTLAGGIAHDFNNILGAILGNAELLRSLPPGGPVAAECLGDILAGSRRAADLVRQILTFSRHQETSRQPLQLEAVTREALRLLRATVPAHVEFRMELTAVPPVLADPSEIHQVVMNLGTNAWHALQDRPGTITVGLAETELDGAFVRLHPELRPGRHVCLTVADDGCGMDAATLGRIFEPFFTTKPVGAGTGLGLSVVHGLVKNHEGGIVVQSRPGEGTAFRLYFPVFAAGAEPAAGQPAPVPPGAGERILFVDDEEPLARMGARMLERLGYRVTPHTRPLEALAAFRAQPAEFDLIVVDYNMPALNGAEFGAQVLAARPGQRLILTTGYSAALPGEARTLGFRELLPKPYDVRGLGETVHRVLREGGGPP